MSKFTSLILSLYLLSFSYLGADNPNQQGDQRTFVTGYATGFLNDYDELASEALMAAMEQLEPHQEYVVIDEIQYSIIPHLIDPSIFTVECKIFFTVSVGSGINSDINDDIPADIH